MISGLSHISLITRDLAKMTRIIIEALSGKEIYDSGEKQFFFSHEKFFRVDEIWIAVTEGVSLPSRTYNHIAFKTDEAGLENAKAAIANLNLEIKPPRPRVEGEGQSVYFYTI